MQRMFGSVKVEVKNTNGYFSGFSLGPELLVIDAFSADTARTISSNYKFTGASFALKCCFHSVKYFCSLNYKFNSICF